MSSLPSLLRQSWKHTTRRSLQLKWSSLSTDATASLGSARSSVNHDEIAHFSKLSSEWWDERGEFSFLHKMNPVRMHFIREKLLEVAQDEKAELEMGSGDVLTGLEVLDVGCGGGLLSESLARMGANTLGIDASKSNIEIASLHASADPMLSPSRGSSSSRSNLSYLNAPAETLISDPKRYDVVCSMEVLEHVDNPAAFLSTCAELLKPGGHLFLSTISQTPLAYALTILLAEDVLRQVSKGTHTYSKFIKPSELVQFFRDYRTPTLRGLIYNPLQARWHLAPRDAWGALECNYIFWVRKPVE
ncbi:hypothetical protein GALMADRAFT_1357454 [Galerina marginata CBS 339.88]|uniref:Ubiquinone biosynthesis O-methyltransferase, mitochondrial n=1 Tax=Galerina marginata (strain CBS 339.88) TaxID=685588 RepID=A0A067TP46_GALM3|nr:hypothetical protein GALMADRAFT_1357454 [Galerina marginata CBS 339.88]